MSDIDLKAIWQMPTDESTPNWDMDQVIKKANAFESKIRRRNIMEWLAALVLVIWCGSELIGAEPGLVALGDVIIILGAMGICVYLWRNGRIDRFPDPALDSRAFLESQVEALDTQADLLKKVPYWYVGPLALGSVVSLIGRSLERGSITPAWMVTSGLVIAVFTGVVVLNLRAAKKLRAEAVDLRRELD